MSDEKLRALVQQLRDELDAIDVDASSAKDSLAAFANHVQYLTGEAREEAPSPDDVQLGMDQGMDLVQQLEVEHPKATAILNEIMVVLGNMGI